MDIEGRPAIVCARIKLIGRKVGRPRCIRLGEIENVKAKQRELALADTEIGDQLILVIDAARLILIQILILAIGPDTSSGGDVIGTGQKRIDVVAVQLMRAARVDIGSGEGDVLAESMLDSNRRLHVNRGREVRRDGVGSGRGLTRGQRDSTPRSWVLYHVLLLIDAILPNGLQD